MVVDAGDNTILSEGIFLVFDITTISNPVKINRINNSDFNINDPGIMTPDRTTFGSRLEVLNGIVRVSQWGYGLPCQSFAGIIRSLDIYTGDLLGSVEYNCGMEPYPGTSNMRIGTWFNPVGSTSMVMSVGGSNTDNGTVVHYDFNPISTHYNYPNIHNALGQRIVEFDPLFNGTDTTPVLLETKLQFDTAFYPDTKKYAFTWSAGTFGSTLGRNAYVLECDAPSDMLIDIPPGTSKTTEIFNEEPASAISGGAPITDDLVVSTSNTYLWDVNFSVDIINPAQPTVPVKDTAELDIKLTSPMGTAVTISSGNGATGAFFSTYFDDAALSNNTVTDATYGYYAEGHAETPLIPESALGAFIGEDPNGTWTIEVVDTAAGGSVATLNSWGLEITTLDATPTDTLVTASQSTVLPISDVAPVADTLTVDALGILTCDVDLVTHITHTAAADLDISLTSPLGTVVTLTTDNGGDHDDVFNGTLWDDSATDIASDYVYSDSVVATALVPEGAMSAFNGENPNGDWTLNITDDSPGNEGVLNGWELEIKTCAAGAPVAADDNLATDEDTPLNGNVLVDNGNGADSDPDMDALTVIEINGSSANVGLQTVLPSQGLITLNSNGTFLYDPNGQFEHLAPGVTSLETFSYTVSDGLSADVGLVSLTVNGRNDPPYLVTHQTGFTVAGVSLIDPSRLAAADPDDDATGLTFTVLTPVTHGELQLNGAGPIAAFTQDDINQNRLSYVHDGGTDLTDSFQFSLADGGEDGAGTVTGTFEINLDVIFYDGFE